MIQFLPDIRKVRNALIVTHQNEDFDAVCSGLILLEMFKNIGIKSDFYILSDNYEKWSFLPYSDHIICFGEEHYLDDRYDLFFAVDTSNLGKYRHIYRKIRNAFIGIIDHHDKIKTDSFDLLIQDEKAAATAQIFYEILMKNFGMITYTQAVNMYAAILSDSMFFRSPKVDWRTHYIFGEISKIVDDADKRFIKQMVMEDRRIEPDYYKLIYYLTNNRVYNYEVSGRKNSILVSFIYVKNQISSNPKYRSILKNKMILTDILSDISRVHYSDIYVLFIEREYKNIVFIYSQNYNLFEVLRNIEKIANIGHATGGVVATDMSFKKLMKSIIKNIKT